MIIKGIDVLVVSAPSGTGKTTLNRRLMSDFPQLQFSVSWTTRAKRKGETEGDHYHFVSKVDFQQQIDQGNMLEWAEVFGNFYGTSVHAVEQIARNNKIALLEIDVIGWKFARKRLKNCYSIFIMPPTIEELWRRLENRGTDDLTTRVVRIRTAIDELRYADIYDTFVINDDIEGAYNQLKSCLLDRQNPQISRSAGIEHSKKLIAEFDRFNLPEI